MHIRLSGRVLPGQDGAVYGRMLFRFDAHGVCTVYDLAGHTDGAGFFPVLGTFALDRAGELCPHSNAVAFGAPRPESGDGFPLLYTNMYNNLSRAQDRMEGTLCVYRITRSGDAFCSELAGLIRVGFVRDLELWESGDPASPDADVRPYGNFAVDSQRGLLHAFVMRDREQITRTFTFRLPEPGAGVLNPRFGVPEVVLQESDITGSFDTPYMRYMQGACCHEHRIWSVEGFAGGTENPPALRILDPGTRRELLYANLADYGLCAEAELIDFSCGRCLYGDNTGRIYTLE